jgi:hypothetical protein
MFHVDDGFLVDSKNPRFRDDLMVLICGIVLLRLCHCKLLIRHRTPN